MYECVDVIPGSWVGFFVIPFLSLCAGCGGRMSLIVVGSMGERRHWQLRELAGFLAWLALAARPHLNHLSKRATQADHPFRSVLTFVDSTLPPEAQPWKAMWGKPSDQLALFCGWLQPPAVSKRVPRLRLKQCMKERKVEAAALNMPRW